MAQRSLGLSPSLAALSLMLACGGGVAGTTARAPAAAARSAADVLQETDAGIERGRLPRDVRPTAEALVLTVDPKAERLAGTVDIDVILDRPRKTVWLHGKDLRVTKATVTARGGESLPAEWKQVDPSGTATLTVARTVPAGAATIHISYEAPLGDRKHVVSGTAYVVAQSEPINARAVFPCFDEPGFKIPFDVTVVTPRGNEVISNAPEAQRTDEGDAVRVRFARTVPLPSYLMTFAIGPFDVVEAPAIAPHGPRTRPIPLRALAARGRGSETAHALASVGPLLGVLEDYFGMAYPFEKLDLIAVPNGNGSLENPGAITFAEAKLLIDPTHASLASTRAFARTMAHELAHQWVGNLVTAAWWDDVWLNEGFATFVGNRAADRWDPSTDAQTDLLRDIQAVMGVDSLASAPSVRAKVASADDISGALGSRVYAKGAAILTMFNRFVGDETFQRGLRTYLEAHRSGTAVADDFLAAESAAAGWDVASAMRTFLDQPGVPFLEAELRCDGDAKLHLTQSRFLPLGSDGSVDQTWQLPVFVRYGIGDQTMEAKTILHERESDISLGPACPDWVFPNADAASYVRLKLAPRDLERLRTKGIVHLNTRERVAFGNGLRAAFGRGEISFGDLVDSASVLASDSHAVVRQEPLAFLREAHDWFISDPLDAKVESYGQKLLASEVRGIRWDAEPSSDGDAIDSRRQLLDFLTKTARLSTVRASARARGLAFLGYRMDGAIHPEAIDPNLRSIALRVVGEEADALTWDALRHALEQVQDRSVRNDLLIALASSSKPALVDRAHALVLDDATQGFERSLPLWIQMGNPKQADRTWRWVEEQFDVLKARIPWNVQLVTLAGTLCREGSADEVASFFTPQRLAGIDGGPAALATTVEMIRLCVARRVKMEPSAREFFSRR